MGALQFDERDQGLQPKTVQPAKHALAFEGPAVFEPELAKAPREGFDRHKTRPVQVQLTQVARPVLDPAIARAQTALTQRVKRPSFEADLFLIQRSFKLIARSRLLLDGPPGPFMAAIEGHDRAQDG